MINTLTDTAPTLIDQLYYLVPLGFLALWFSYERGLSLMMFFQQEEYDGPRFIKWLQQKRGYDKAASGWFLFAGILGALSHLLFAENMLMQQMGPLLIPLIILGFLHGIIISKRVRNNNKKPLVITTRVKRILSVYLGLVVLDFSVISFLASLAPKGEHYALGVASNAESWFNTLTFSELAYNWQTVALAFLLIGLCQGLPALLVLATKLLEPMEERLKAGFRNEAIEKFNRLKPKVIAITGSFGKTSTKHILSHILEAAAPSLATPGSVNTDMGITRVIREQLKPEHQFFIVEMGAYGPGSIARLCKLTPPDVGLITAVGAAHYERFKSLETVAKAKFELAQATFTQGGNVVVNTDGIHPALLAEQISNTPGNYCKVGTSGDVSLESCTQTADGLTLQIQDGNEAHTLKVPLYGAHQSGNILLAAACAHSIGLPWAAIKGALASVPQIRHRLEVSKNSSGPTLVNDAYNSNPVGFASALGCLNSLVGEGGRRILVTPGMVELGTKHAEEHETLGKLAAESCDIILVVTPARIPTFLTGVQKANNGKTTVMTFEKQQEAEDWVTSNWKEADVVLFENNLPDLYEATFSF
ncbi:MAG: UDP-N-acetylmuramoyl-tripeptide--D-alanyl-D-alanine ligase [Kordiimonadaceae bacterium]|nr:UDP-N-acetylmuramoyl-tripeptide--D-alanyl-D-alanine ligase [Kordiimonadaceae bacterium]